MRWVLVIFCSFCSTSAYFLYGEPCSERNTAHLYPHSLIIPKNHTTKCLDLSGAKKPSNIKKLTDDALQKIKEVDTLYADRLNLNKVPKLVIHKLPQLHMIDLTYNRIKRVPTILDSVAPNVTTLLLDHNKLLILKKRPLFTSLSLTTLSLTSNGITNVYPITFSKMPLLKVLYLNKNSLKVFNILPFIKGVVYLNLEENCIWDLPSKKQLSTVLRHYLTDGQCKGENDPKAPIK